MATEPSPTALEQGDLHAHHPQRDRFISNDTLAHRSQRLVGDHDHPAGHGWA